MTESLFDHYPDKPNHIGADGAYLILVSSHESASSFLQSFEAIHADREAEKVPTDVEQDLLRAMLIFASAGMDSMVKQLIKDALPLVIATNTGAQQQFKVFIKRKLKRKELTDYEFLANIIGDLNPRQVLIDELINELTSNSLQSVEQLLKVASFFDIPSAKITSDRKLLNEVFKARNYIVHEMDVDLGQPDRNRRPREREQMTEYTTMLFEVSTNFLSEVDLRLQNDDS
jgi:hypothetical protein